jgi:hypothetical protein
MFSFHQMYVRMVHSIHPSAFIRFLSSVLISNGSVLMVVPMTIPFINFQALTPWFKKSVRAGRACLFPPSGFPKLCCCFFCLHKFFFTLNIPICPSVYLIYYEFSLNTSEYYYLLLLYLGRCVVSWEVVSIRYGFNAVITPTRQIV